MTIPVTQIVDVVITVSPTPLASGNFSVLNIITSDTGGPIDATTRLKRYTSLDEIVADFGASAEATKAATTYFSQSPPPRECVISFRDDGNETITESLNAIENFSPAWYGFIFTKEVRDTAIIAPETTLPALEEAAVWAEPRVKMFQGVANDNVNTRDSNVTTDIGSILLDRFTRTFLTESSSPDEYPDASAFGRIFTVDFTLRDSTITLKFKQLPTITPEDLLQSELNTLNSKRYNAYYRVGNAVDSVSIYAESFMCKDFFVDEIHNIDWLTDAIQNRAFNRLFTEATKVPLTDKGGAIMENEVIKALDDGVNNGAIAPGTDIDGNYLDKGYVTEVQAVADIPPGAPPRRGPNVAFKALFPGAIHSMQVNGVVER